MFYILQKTLEPTNTNLRVGYDTLYLVQLSLIELEENLVILETKKTQFEKMAMAALETTDLEEKECQTGAVVPENVAVMAKMLQKAFGS